MTNYSGYDHLRFEHDGGVLTVILDRPEVLNAVNPRMHEELARVFREIKDDHDVRAVVLTGAGKGFCAGGDIEQTPKEAGKALDDFFADARTIIVDILEMPQPLIAAVNGAAIGLGATLALFADFTYISSTAKIGDPHVVVGVVAGDGGTVIWPWLVGMKRAKEFLLTGDSMTADEALTMGLVNKVIAPDELMKQAHELARRMATAPRRAIEGTKAALNSILRSTLTQSFDQALAVEKECFASGDHARAVEVFRSNRAPAS